MLESDDEAEGTLVTLPPEQEMKVELDDTPAKNVRESCMDILKDSLDDSYPITSQAH